MRFSQLHIFKVVATIVLFIGRVGWAAHTVALTPIMFGSSGPNPNEPAARQALVQVIRAQNTVSRAADEKERDFESSEQWQQAVTELHQACIEHDRIRSSALAGLRDSKEYKSDQLEMYKLQESLDHERGAKQPDMRLVTSLASQLLDIRSSVSKSEEDILSRNDELRKARYAMIDAHAKVSALRKSFVESIRFDPQWRAARAQLDQARATLKSIGR